MLYKANILVVDDDQSLCEGIATVLTNAGYAVDNANNGKDALAMVTKNKYALALVDLMLPGINGIEVLQQIKKQNPNITVIMITGYPSIKTAVESIKFSAFDYIPKPFTPDELRSLVGRALERRLAYEEIAQQTGIIEEKLVGIAIPQDIYCMPDHSWAKLEADGTVRIGMHHVYSRSLKGITSVEFPGENEIRHQGEVCLRIVDAHNQVMRLWTPVSGKVIRINQEISLNFSLLIHDPYDGGWLVLMEPTQFEEDIKNLVYFGEK